MRNVLSLTGNIDIDNNLIDMANEFDSSIAGKLIGDIIDCEVANNGGTGTNIVDIRKGRNEIPHSLGYIPLYATIVKFDSVLALEYCEIVPEEFTSNTIVINNYYENSLFRLSILLLAKRK
jgi:hypothetical protein